MSQDFVHPRKRLASRSQNDASALTISQERPRDRQYGPTVVSDQAVALLGDVHGSFINVNIGTENAHSDRVVRLNQVFDTYTIETVHSFVASGPLTQRGASSSVQKRWERKEDLGAGVFGEVHREEYTDLQGHASSRAVKVLRRRQLQRLQIDHKRELDALIRLSKPEYNHLFVEFLCWYEQRDSIFIAMEFVPLGDLEVYIKAGLYKTDVKMIAAQILDGICVMHSLDLVHRDLKPANIFMVRSEPWHVKIGDFGVCKGTTTQQTTLHTSVGTDGYKAPEILGLVPGEKANCYSEKCDMWSYGCILFEMLTMGLPFSTLQDLNTFYVSGSNSTTAEFVLHHPDAWPFVRGLLKPNPTDRFSAWQAQDTGSDWFSPTCRSSVLVDHEVAPSTQRPTTPENIESRGETAEDQLDMGRKGIGSLSSGTTRPDIPSKKILNGHIFPQPIIRDTRLRSGIESTPTYHTIRKAQRQIRMRKGSAKFVEAMPASQEPPIDNSVNKNLVLPDTSKNKSMVIKPGTQSETSPAAEATGLPLPRTTRHTGRISEDEWNIHKSKLKELHNLKLTRQQILDTISLDFGDTKPTYGQLCTQFDKWDFQVGRVAPSRRMGAREKTAIDHLSRLQESSGSTLNVDPAAGSEKSNRITNSRVRPKQFQEHPSTLLKEPIASANMFLEGNEPGVLTVVLVESFLMDDYDEGNDIKQWSLRWWSNARGILHEIIPSPASFQLIGFHRTDRLDFVFTQHGSAVSSAHIDLSTVPEEHLRSEFIFRSSSIMSSWFCVGELRTLFTFHEGLHRLDPREPVMYSFESHRLLFQRCFNAVQAVKQSFQSPFRTPSPEQWDKWFPFIRYLIYSGQDEDEILIRLRELSHAGGRFTISEYDLENTISRWKLNGPIRTNLDCNGEELLWMFDEHVSTVLQPHNLT